MAKTTTTTKTPAAKTSPAKGKPAAKTTQAPAAPAPTLAYTLIDGFRPTAGGRLFAHTMAVFQLTGLLDGKHAPSSTLTRALGNTAMAYHAGKFETTPAGKTLTPAGLAFFNARGHNAEWRARFVSVLSTGKPDGDMVKNESGIKALAK